MARTMAPMFERPLGTRRVPSLPTRTLLWLAILAAPAAAPAAIAQDGAAPAEEASPQIDIGPPPDLGDTSAMDPAVVSFVQGKIDAVKGEPGNVEHWIELGLALEANSMWTPAEAAYGQVIELIPEKTEWRFRRGVVRFSLGDLPGSREDLAAAAEAFKNTPVVQARYGSVLRVAGELEAAEAAWRQAIVAEAAQKPPIEYPQSRVGLAHTLLDLDEAEEANALCEEALALNPGDRHAQFIRGRALRELGRDEEAAVALRIGEDSFPSFPPDPHRQRLDASMRGFSRRMMIVENMMQAGKVADARRILDEVIAERPDDFMVLNLAAKAASRSGDRVGALELLNRSLELAPNEPDTHIELCLLDLDEANRTLSTIAQMEFAASQGRPQDPATMSTMREAGAEKGKKALEHAAKAVELAPYVGRAHFWLGMSQRINAGFIEDRQAQAQQLQGALRTLQNAGKIGCVEPQYHQQVSALAAQLGQISTALRHATSHLHANPSDPAALQSVIQLLVANQQPGEISPYVERLLELAKASGDIAMLQYAVQGFLTTEEYDKAEDALAAFEAAAAGNPQAAQFAASVREHIATKKAAGASAPGGDDKR